MQVNAVPRVGDTFRLKSGGPTMTVYDIEHDNQTLHCGWFWRGRYSKDRFNIGELEPVDVLARFMSEF